MQEMIKMHTDYTLKILLMKTYLDDISRDIDKIITKHKAANKDTLVEVERCILNVPKLADEKIAEIVEDD